MKQIIIKYQVLDENGNIKNEVSAVIEATKEAELVLEQLTTVK